MMEFLFGLCVFVLAIGALALGMLTGRGPIEGSCGGNAAIDSCPLCKQSENQR